MQAATRRLPFLQRFGVWIARGLAPTPISPNMVTALSLIAGVGGAYAFTHGPGPGANIGAALFSFARLLDHVDGALARLQNKSSRFGYYFDYVAGGASYTCLFAGIGFGLADTQLGNWAILLGLIASGVAFVSVFLNLDVDRLTSAGEPEFAGYAQFAGLTLEDGIHILLPVTWFGLLLPFFVVATVVAAIYGLYSLVRVARLRLRDRAD